MSLHSSPLDDDFLRVKLVLAGMLAALFFLGGWLWHIQVHRGAHFEQDQLKQSVRRVRIPGVRGRLFDRRENCVADNRASYNIVIYMEELRKPGKWDRTIDHVLKQLDELGGILGTPSELDRDKLRAHIRRSLPLPLIAWRDVSDEVLARFAEQADRTPGVDIQVDNVRLYPFGARACHVLGYVGRADIEQDEAEPYHYYLPEMTGRSGLEKSLDEELRGEAGGRLVRVDATGFRRYDSGQREAKSGVDVQLTLDMRIQSLAEDALGEVPGSVVVIDPRNGDVLAMASTPGYDPNNFVPRISTAQWKALNEDERYPLVNRAVAGGYAPGSTYKPVTALAGLEDGTSHDTDVHSCPGYYQMGRTIFRCWNHSGHGAIAMRQALERSCNVYFFHVGLQTGVERLAAESRAFGLGRKTGIELDYELAGNVPDTAWKRRTQQDGWRDGDTCNMSIGQGALVVTPLQMASLTATLANSGTVYRPRLVRGMRTPGERSFTEQKPDVVHRMDWRPEDIALVRNGMRDVVNGSWGTARKVALPNVVVAGKTGTAEFGRKDEKKRHAWMIAFAPFDQPRYAIAMLVDEGVSGGETAAPRMLKLLTGLFAPTPGGGTRMNPIVRFLLPLKRLDWGFMLTVLALMSVGLAFIFSASSRSEGTVLTELTQRQVVWVLVGLSLFAAVVMTDYRRLGESAWAAYAVGLVLLVLVLFIGKQVYGAVRWLNLFGIQIQPSEFAKLGTVIFLARFLSSPGRDMADPRTLLQTLVIIALPMLLILKQPDLGTASTLIPVAFVMMFVAGIPLKYLLLLIGLGVLAAVPGWFVLHDYQQERILVFFDPARDPLGTGWNSIQSGIAVGSGGLTGKGFMMGTQNILGFLPKTVAPTDFIFSVIGEETGFVGSVVLLALFAALVGGCLRASLASRDKLGRVLSVGVVSLLFSHIFVNMAMTVGLMPITGLPLPLISYGGSFMMSTMLGLGLVQSVYVRRIRR